MVIDVGLVIAILIMAIVFHEVAHGWTAYKLGDPTAKLMGRLTLNPLKHVDPVGTVILPGTLIALSMLGFPTVIFGWAKPVPVNFHLLRRPRQDMMRVALAGPAANIAFALVLAALVKTGIGARFMSVWRDGIFLNLLLAVFNLIPVPPLDGSRVLMRFLPDSLAVPYARLERYGLLIIVGMLYLGILHKIIFPIVFTLGRFLGVSFT